MKRTTILSGVGRAQIAFLAMTYIRKYLFTAMGREGELKFSRFSLGAKLQRRLTQPTQKAARLTIVIRGKDIIMAKQRHKSDTKTFEELSYAEQAKSISAQLIAIQRSIRAHMRRAEEESRGSEKTMLKCIGQVIRMLSRLTG